MANKFCMQCGTELPEHANFCCRCGARQEVTAPFFVTPPTAETVPQETALPTEAVTDAEQDPVESAPVPTEQKKRVRRQKREANA